MTLFSNIKINVKAVPASTSYLLKKVKFWVKNEAKLFYETEDCYFLFLNGETQNLLKNEDFLPNNVLNYIFSQSRLTNCTSVSINVAKVQS